ncbi:hypothetical protein E2562_015581 [Oryza meyeriana var. granulata]|uniref:Uncharacterized protein n=1 Tax=Oryza meyeriana var. granulata TaxID=110450 RepID=A0A6G1EL65_9ORYZ|nr:hypothetical protein E2562_015581 [Oryza meyeriana var. granulata]
MKTTGDVGERKAGSGRQPQEVGEIVGVRAVTRPMHFTRKAEAWEGSNERSDQRFVSSISSGRVGWRLGKGLIGGLRPHLSVGVRGRGRSHKLGRGRLWRPNGGTRLGRLSGRGAREERGGRAIACGPRRKSGVLPASWATTGWPKGEKRPGLAQGKAG